MAKTTLSPIAMPGPYAIAPSTLAWTAADVAEGNQFASTGKEILLARNADVTNPHNVTITSTPEPVTGRTGHITNYSIPASEFRVFQLFPVVGWKQNDGFIYVTADSAQIEFAVLRLP